ncbi:U24-ctenitoxin-Pn1a [Parasteatoda tepidariorum]|uniref:U24-ctenitoxin-Pn1a n=1 Tax=Parasteatoda tepidariorum TaxID=114398 RepID=UPI00077FB8DA|nr:U24-ctenitoxin-Pn1a-like [Parasteatoda tepidariorum]
MKYALLIAVASMVVCAALARSQSECEKRREEALKHETIMKLIPKCKENGDYEELQCYKDSTFCVCYTKDGRPASPNLSNLKECGCFLEKQRKIDSNHENPYLPQCQDDGSWNPKQCYDYNNSCWCVDKNGKQVGDIKHEGKGLDC